MTDQSRFLIVPVLAVSVIAASFTIADGCMTPAVSVLSAIEGLEIINSNFSQAVIPVTIVILVIFFLLQR